MPAEPKPLFRPDVLRTHLSAFELPSRVDSVRPKLRDWAKLLTSARGEGFKEQELLPDFLTDYFVELLGYRRPADSAERYTFSREKHVEVDGKFADAVLGDFREQQRFIVALEGKGPKDPLERPFAGRRMSAVDQGYRYAINLPCDWIIVTSMRQTRLYFKGADQHTYERFDTDDLAHNEGALRRFVFLLGADRVVPESGRSHLYELLGESERVGRELTRDFYEKYAAMRQQAFDHLRRDNPAVPRDAVLGAAQKLLDRVLFCAFCEDRGLLPTDTIQRAYEHRDPYHPRPIWDNFRGLFHAVNTGNAALGIHAYNGGLFAPDPVLDSLTISDEVCGHFRELGEYDYRPAHLAGEGTGSLIDVDILGHIFEQSITDLERLRLEPEAAAEPKSRRKREGAFYTPSFITRYIVEQALGGVLRQRFERLRQAHEADARGTARVALADPSVYQLDKLKNPQREALVRFWEAWQDDLATVRLLDPACGSGAFLIEAFDQLHTAYDATNARLKELRGSPSLFDLDKQILERNLYGVDLNEEAIEICRLSLWIKTAQRGKPLTSLDHTIRVGNSIVDHAAVHPKAFRWRDEFPEVFEAGGFDVVVGNPPYVRQELLSPFKPYLQESYRAYHGMADLYVYFYELGLRMLKPGGLLSFIVTNKWMKAGYGEPLRRFFTDHAWIESVVDFGHAKQIFEDADVFPSILVACRPTDAPKPRTARLCTIPREQLRIDDLSRQIQEEGVDLPLDQLSSDGWQMEPTGVTGLMAKLRDNGVPLAEFAGVKPLSGVKTGFNDAFLIDTKTRNAILAEDAGSSEIIKRYVRGQDIERWNADWQDLWMIFTRRGIDISRFPGVARYLERFRKLLEPKPRDWQGESWPGRKSGAYQWFEIQDLIDYWQDFARPKIVYQDIAWRPQFCIDNDGMLSNNTVYFLPSGDSWILAVLNSPAAWWFSWRSAQHGKDEALRLFKPFMQGFPIPRPTDDARNDATVLVAKLVERATAQHEMRRTILDWLRVEHEVEKPTLKLQQPLDLDDDAFIAEVRKVRGKKRPLTAPALKNLRDEHAHTIEPARVIARESLSLEHRLSDLVNAAYGLSPAEVDLMWKTAPPRMPFSP